jgi:protein-S-isoprenylcysteine O-methyltransferase Ste14
VIPLALHEELERDGAWLFRWRSYLPLVLLVLAVVVMSEFSYPGNSEELDIAWETFCLLVSTTGLVVRAFTIGYTPRGTSGRNTAGQVAEELNTTGIYSVVRHPLYLGNFIMMLGISLFPHQWWFTLIYVLAFWLYYERIMSAEERFLREKFGAQFTAWAARTPPFIPNPKLWEPSVLPFSFRNVLRREYNGFFAMVLTFFFLEVRGDFAVQGKLMVETGWMVLLAVSAVIWIVLRTLKRKTTVLNVEGRQ